MRPTCFTITFNFSDGEVLKLLHSVSIWSTEDALNSMQKMSICRDKSDKGVYIKDIDIHYFCTLKEALSS